MIALENVSVRFADRAASEILALHAVSLRFKPGSFNVLIGPSGSGKTTLLHVVAGILVPSAGDVRVDDLPLKGMSEGKRDAWRRRNCGLIFQDFRLIDELSPVSNVLVPSWFTTMRTSPRMRERAEALLAHFNVPFRSGPVAALSRGQQQRVAMARALLLEPMIVLADEPTASVDKANAELIIQEMHRLARSGKTVICASHDERVAHHADKILHIEDGRFVGEASEPTRSIGNEVL